MTRIIVYVFSIAAWLFMLPEAVKAQDNTRISGKVVDSNKRSLAFSTVILSEKLDSSNVVGTSLTDTAGVYVINGVKPGEYRLKAMQLGYSQNKLLTVVLSSAGPLDVAPIVLMSSSTNLGEVIVKGEKALAEYSLGKLTVNVSTPFFKSASSALEVLRRSPSVQVSPDGKVTVKGSIPAVVYVDGKQLPLSVEELRSLATTDIDQIEVMSNASAQYDGETRAVINIKLKRDKTHGLKGSSYLGGNINRKYGGFETGVSATYKTANWAYYGRLGYYERNDFLNGIGTRIVREKDQVSIFNTDNFFHYYSKPLSYQFAADYLIKKNHTIGVLIKGSLNNRVDKAVNTTTVSNQTVNGNFIESALLNNNNTSIRRNNISVDLNYKALTNERGDEFSVYVDYSRFRLGQSQKLITSVEEGKGIAFPATLYGDFPVNTNILAGRVDQILKISNAAKIGFGAKFSNTITNNELLYDTLAYGVFSRDYTRSNIFKYAENIAAAYVSYSHNWKHNSFEAGLRAEHTNSTGNSLTLGNSVSRNYVNLLPSIQYEHRFKDEQVLSFSTGRKMARPSFYDLNPFQLYLNPYEYTEGNPTLLPTIILSSEIKYSIKNIYFAVGYEQNKNLIVQFPSQDNQTKVIKYTKTNLNNVYLISLEALHTASLTTWWKIKHSVYAFKINNSSTYDGQYFNNSAFTGTFAGQHVFSLKNKLTLDLRYEYTAPGAQQIYTVKSSGSVDIGAQKTILNNNGSIQFTLNDLFNTYRESYYGKFYNIDVANNQKKSQQQMSLRFTYRFGNSAYVRPTRIIGNAEEESRVK